MIHDFRADEFVVEPTTDGTMALAKSPAFGEVVRSIAVTFGPAEPEDIASIVRAFGHGRLSMAVVAQGERTTFTLTGEHGQTRELVVDRSDGSSSGGSLTEAALSIIRTR